MRKESVNNINTNTPLILELFLMGRMDLIDTWIMNIRLQVSEFELQITTFLSSKCFSLCLVNNTHS